MIYIVLSLIGTIVAAIVASGKQRNTLGWGIFGLCLPVIAIVAVLCVPPLAPQQQLPRAS